MGHKPKCKKGFVTLAGATELNAKSGDFEARCSDTDTVNISTH